MDLPAFVVPTLVCAVMVALGWCLRRLRGRQEREFTEAWQTAYREASLRATSALWERDAEKRRADAAEEKYRAFHARVEDLLLDPEDEG